MLIKYEYVPKYSIVKDTIYSIGRKKKKSFFHLKDTESLNLSKKNRNHKK